MGKLTTEAKTQIISFVLEFGKLSGCQALFDGELSWTTINRAIEEGGRYYDPDFAQAVKQARKDHKLLHHQMEKDPRAHDLADKMFMAVLEAGQSNEVSSYDKHGNLIGRKVYRRAGIPFWMWQVLHPPKTLTEETVVMATSAIYQHIEQTDLAPDKKQLIEKVLYEWTQIEMKQLREKGVKLSEEWEDSGKV